MPIYEKTSLHDTTLCQEIIDAATGIVDDAIIALGVGSFTVDDTGSDAHPNKLNQVYQAIAFGW